MIYKLYCGLIMSGYAACSTLLGGYMMHYAGAREVDLGFIFMVQPMTIFFRPFICAHSDRRQIHRQMLALFATLTALAYVPFIAYPFWRAPPAGPGGPGGQPRERLVFWLLMLFHLVGSVGFCGVRSLGDALAVNYAKRTGTDFARFRKYGSMSYGVCNFLLGFINQDWLVPNFVPALCVYSGSMVLLAALVYSWPREFFIMSCQDNEDERAQRAYLASLPGPGASLRHALSRLCCGLAAGGRPDAINRFLEDKPGQAQAPPQTKTPAKPERRQLSVGQQLRIFALLLRRDFRIGLYLLVILYGGLTGYSGPNFVFTYINLVCSQRGTCKGSELSGLVMLGYCFVETSVYVLVDRHGHRFNRLLALECTFLVLALHYCFYGFVLEHVSPYFFLVESLHGIEYGISLTSSVELGYYFAREVELLLPELARRGVVGARDDLELVKVSLMATMSGCYTLAYDGAGCILGCLLFGLVLGAHGFNVMWVSIGAAAGLGFAVILVVYALGRCLGVRPEILRIRDRRRAEAAAAAPARA